MNMFLVYNALNLNPKDIQVMLFDKYDFFTFFSFHFFHSLRHPDGPYFDLIKRAYSSSHPLIRHDYFQKKKVSFF